MIQPRHVISAYRRSCGERVVCGWDGRNFAVEIEGDRVREYPVRDTKEAQREAATYYRHDRETEAGHY